jgi:hypothetical protein
LGAHGLCDRLDLVQTGHQYRQCEVRPPAFNGEYPLEGGERKDVGPQAVKGIRGEYHHSAAVEGANRLFKLDQPASGVQLMLQDLIRPNIPETYFGYPKTGVTVFTLPDKIGHDVMTIPTPILPRISWL